MWKTRRSGHEKQRSSADHRDPYERDRTRLIHSEAFRRLQRKTQIFGTQEGDFHRTRLTHSLEVDSIARSLVHNLCNQLLGKGKKSLDEIGFPSVSTSETAILASKLPSSESLRSSVETLGKPISSKLNGKALLPFLPTDDLITAIALSHDIGHPPFGHGGESALNYMMREHGGFESNGQTLRLLTKLEISYNPFGLDLTRRTLLGILKYPKAYSKLSHFVSSSGHHGLVKINDWAPPKCYLDEEQPEVDWILDPLNAADKKLFQSEQNGKTLYHSLDCSIMNIADDIAYGVHDLEDAIYLKLMTREKMDIPQLSALFQHAFPQGVSSSATPTAFLNNLFHANAARRKEAIGDLVNGFITSVFLTTVHADFDEPLLRYNAELPEAFSELLNYFQKIVLDHVINSHEGRVTEYGGQTVIRRLFEAVASNPEQLLSLMYRESYQKAASEREGMRVICDYIASMTDDYAHRLHERLFGFGQPIRF
jgi:dGTPase